MLGWGKEGSAFIGVNFDSFVAIDVPYLKKGLEDLSCIAEMVYYV